MEQLISESMACDFASDGITELSQLKQTDKREFALQLFSEEADIGDQISMLIDSTHFQSIPRLLLQAFKVQDLGVENQVYSGAINSLIQEDIQKTIANKMVDSLITTYTIKMNRLLLNANDNLEEVRQSSHNDSLYTQFQEGVR